jgi:hypothetical protein
VSLVRVRHGGSSSPTPTPSRAPPGAVLIDGESVIAGRRRSVSNSGDSAWPPARPDRGSTLAGAVVLPACHQRAITIPYANALAPRHRRTRCRSSCGGFLSTGLWL